MCADGDGYDQYLTSDEGQKKKVGVGRIKEELRKGPGIKKWCSDEDYVRGLARPVMSNPSLPTRLVAARRAQQVTVGSATARLDRPVVALRDGFGGANHFYSAGSS
jgi:hypothetical protein